MDQPSPPASAETAADGRRFGIPAWLWPFLLAIAFFASAAGLVVEIVAGRMLAPYVGMSLYTWTSVIAVVLAGFSIGHWIGGVAADRREKTAWAVLAGSLFGAALSTLAAVWQVALVSGPILQAFPHPVAGITLLAAALFLLPSLFVGIPSPIIARLALFARPDRTGRRLGALYAAGAVGAIAGTLAAGYFFISWLGSTKTLIAVAGLYAVLGGLVSLAAARHLRGIGITSGAALAATFAGLLATPDIAIEPCDRESDYYCLRSVDVSEDFGQPARAMVIDHLGHGINVRDRSDLLVMPYTAIMDRLVAVRFPQTAIDAFFIGGGAYTLPRSWHEAGRLASAVIAEIDPEVTALAAREFWVDTDAFRILHKDGRIALNDLADQRFDVIVGDAFTDIAVPAHLITREFLQLVDARLTDDGIYLMNLVDRADRRQALAAMIRTLASVFPEVSVWIEAEDLKAGGRTSFVLAAGRTALPLGPYRTADGTGRAILRMRDDRLTALLEETTVPVFTDDYAPIDRLIAVKD